MGRKGWLLFALLQVLGAWIPTYTNIHMNIAPVFAGLLLLPGILVWFAFPDLGWWSLFIALPVNALTWHFIVKRCKKDSDPSFRSNV